MKEQLIEFSTAKLAKEKGFDVPCKHRFFIGNGDLEEQVTHDRKSLRVLEVSMKHFRNTEINYFLRPTQSLLQKWLREKHNIFLESKQLSYGDTQWTVVDSSGTVLIESKVYMYYDGYPVKDHRYEHEGLEIVLQNALKLI